MRAPIGQPNPVYSRINRRPSAPPSQPRSRALSRMRPRRAMPPAHPAHVINGSWTRRLSIPSRPPTRFVLLAAHLYGFSIPDSVCVALSREKGNKNLQHVVTVIYRILMGNRNSSEFSPDEADKKKYSIERAGVGGGGGGGGELQAISQYARTRPHDRVRKLHSTWRRSRLGYPVNNAPTVWNASRWSDRGGHFCTAPLCTPLKRPSFFKIILFWFIYFVLLFIDLFM